MAGTKPFAPLECLVTSLKLTVTEEQRAASHSNSESSIEGTTQFSDEKVSTKNAEVNWSSEEL